MPQPSKSGQGGLRGFPTGWFYRDCARRMCRCHDVCGIPLSGKTRPCAMTLTHEPCHSISYTIEILNPVKDAQPLTYV